MNRRDLLKGLAAGGIFVAGELWIPGQKLISIPTVPEPVFEWSQYSGPSVILWTNEIWENHITLIRLGEIMDERCLIEGVYST